MKEGGRRKVVRRVAMTRQNQMQLQTKNLCYISTDSCVSSFGRLASCSWRTCLKYDDSEIISDLKKPICSTKQSGYIVQW